MVAPKKTSVSKPENLSLSDLHFIGGDYFVAPDGDDNNPGTLDSPWGSWQKAFETAMPGDTVYFRGGVWYPSSTAYGNNITLISSKWSKPVGHNGEPGNPICYFNYPGETPILDCRKMVAPGTAPNNRYIAGINDA